MGGNLICLLETDCRFRNFIHTALSTLESSLFVNLCTVHPCNLISSSYLKNYVGNFASLIPGYHQAGYDMQGTKTRLLFEALFLRKRVSNMIGQQNDTYHVICAKRWKL